jgi:hypothetical protein
VDTPVPPAAGVDTPAEEEGTAAEGDSDSLLILSGLNTCRPQGRHPNRTLDPTWWHFTDETSEARLSRFG